MRRAIPWIFGLLLVLGIGGWTLRAYLHEVAQSGEAAPIGALKSIATAESIFRERPGNGRYGTLAQLRDSKLVDPVLGSGTKQGYIFEAHASTTTPEFLWWALARPRSPEEGDRIFFVNQAGASFYRIVTRPEDLAVAIDPETAAVPSEFMPVGK